MKSTCTSIILGMGVLYSIQGRSEVAPSSCNPNWERFKSPPKVSSHAGISKSYMKVGAKIIQVEVDGVGKIQCTEKKFEGRQYGVGDVGTVYDSALTPSADSILYSVTGNSSPSRVISVPMEKARLRWSFELPSEQHVANLEMDPDGQIVIGKIITSKTSKSSGVIALDIKTGAPIKLFSALVDADFGAPVVQLSPDRKVLILQTRAELIAKSFESGATLWRQPHADVPLFAGTIVPKVTFSRDSNLLLYSDLSGWRWKILKLQTGQTQTTIKQHGFAAVSNNSEEVFLTFKTKIDEKSVLQTNRYNLDGELLGTQTAPVYEDKGEGVSGEIISSSVVGMSSTMFVAYRTDFYHSYKHEGRSTDYRVGFHLFNFN